ncbi:MAG: 2-oxoglutarate dehydrogenase E1 component [Anaerolineaceae bacterium]|nr:MAG: 2-oxoglutarate dehydrogenase E1 component [Anaerolineaceae bacterium]
MSVYPEFHGPNMGYILELYELYREAPDSVDAQTRAFFRNWEPLLGANGQSAVAIPADVDITKAVSAKAYADAVRQYGHLAAQLDPLGSPPPGDPELDISFHGITLDDLAQLPASIIGGAVARECDNALEAVEMLKEIYASNIGYDNDHIRIPEEREWLREAVESRRYRFDPSNDADIAMLERLTQVESFEHYLQRSFPSKYRFSIEGLDMMVPIIDQIIKGADGKGMKTIAIAMAHRGRLNILAHIMQKPYEQILADFKDPIKLQEIQDAIGWTIGDVKYHKGESRNIDESGGLTLTMPPNPSHLEAINPVAVGMARAAGTSDDHAGEPQFDPALTMQILIHGDAAFPGQGIVAETLNLSRLPGYWTGGTIHIIANNQLGFTTDPEDGRSTIYASDLAKGFKVPIIHVNADDPEAGIEVARIAFAYQRQFGKDVLIDLIGYRRYGHNELDEPGFTQPELYGVVRQHPSVRKLWADRLVENGRLESDTPQQMIDHYMQVLQAANDKLEEAATSTMKMEAFQDHQPPKPEPGMAKRIETAVSLDDLRAINDGLDEQLDRLQFYSKRLENTIRARRKAFDDIDEKSVDWATAEELAFASILAEGTPIRLTGQDTERGTFSHRHAVLHDKESGEKVVPLQSFRQAKAPFEVHNSPLSEEAVIGFEFGYNVQAPNRLVLWEAQYGDFANGAQNIIDEFVVSAREKWGQTPSMVLLLPHGHEGAGPDHSSGRPERFLQSAAKTNIRIANCTTAAQYFHLLRRQALLLKSDPLPLVVLTPKSLLRNPATASSVRELTEGRWRPVIDDPHVEPEAVERLVFVSGKFYVDLVENEERDKAKHVAVARVEQLYPFPAESLKKVIARYPNLKQIVWAQEEPKNMGAWEFMNYRIKKMVGIKMPVNYVGRRRSSSPAEGSKSAHQVNQSMIIDYAFNWQFDK